MKYNYNLPSTYTILIVDDEATSRYITSESLNAYGYATVNFASPKEALAYFEGYYRSIDLVLLDMIMPEMNGEDLFYAMNRINPVIPIVILSGTENLQENYKHLLALGVKKLLAKPISHKDLVDNINHIINRDMTIDIEKALSTLVNDERLYLKFLDMYYEEYANFENNVQKYISDYNYLAIRNLVHKIKGVSLNLGSDEVYRLTTLLDQKLLKKEVQIEEINYFINYHNLVLKDIRRILRLQNV